MFYKCNNLQLVEIHSPAIASKIISQSSSGYLVYYAETIVLPDYIANVGSYITKNFQYVESFSKGDKNYIYYSNHSHNWIIVEAIDSIPCEKDGIKIHICEVCGAEKTEIVNKHLLSKYDAKSPSCTSIGWKEYESCSRCDYTTFEELAALGHDEVHHGAKAPTCTEYGWDAYVICTRCDYSTYNKLDELGHAEGNVVMENNVSPDCVNNGSYDNVVYCTSCMVELSRKTVVVDALGHDEVDYEAKAPTCNEYGWDPYETCSRCDYTTYNRLDALGHTKGNIVVENNVSPDCVNNGNYDNVVYCTVCHVELSRETITVNALGHDYSYIISGDTIVYTCQNCSHTYEESFGERGISVSNSPFDTAWNLDFTTTVSTQYAIANSVTFTLVYDTQIVSFKSIQATSGVTVDSSVNGKLIVTITEVKNAESTLFDITFTTSDYLVSGSYDFIKSLEGELVRADFTQLTIYEIGDVNMDGKISAKDVMLIKQYVVKMIDFTDVQKAYANTYVDYDNNGGENISSRDALLIQQSIVKMDVTLGDRVEITFVYEDKEVKRSVHNGEELKVVPVETEGMSWSESATDYIAPNFHVITEEKRYYLVSVSRKEN